MFTCRLCGRGFNTFSEFYRHLKSECMRVPKTRKCPVCGVRFKTIRRMRRHLINAALVDVQHRNYIMAVS